MMRLTLALIALSFSTAISAQTQVPNTFQAGQPARAVDVNANFDALENAVDDVSTQIGSVVGLPRQLYSRASGSGADLTDVIDMSLLAHADSYIQLIDDFIDYIDVFRVPQ